MRRKFHLGRSRDSLGSTQQCYSFFEVRKWLGIVKTPRSAGNRWVLHRWSGQRRTRVSALTGLLLQTEIWDCTLQLYVYAPHPVWQAHGTQNTTCSGLQMLRGDQKGAGDRWVFIGHFTTSLKRVISAHQDTFALFLRFYYNVFGYLWHPLANLFNTAS